MLTLFLWSAPASPEPPKPAPATVDFNRDIRPILTENCYKCHGPDDGARKAKLRFDVRAEALKPAKSGNIAIVPGAPEKSEMIARITAADEDDRMPPLKTGKTLKPNQIELLRRWIVLGAPYATHWAYVKPTRPPLPEVKNKTWAQNPVDLFILARLEREGLKPSRQADRYTLIRRVSLDLTGLPPTPAEVEDFVKDRRPDAYEKLVDRLLARPSFGEHWARMWLDLARYADSAGYADDPPRTIWAYRDYVIKAFNANKPFDRFTLEQIAGDLLSDPSEEDLVATAFHRNTMTNNEGGTEDEEFRNAAVIDRVNTTMAVWMATSMGCCQCHNHKYDPLTQQEYFRLFAIFNNSADADLNDESPVLPLYTPQEKEQRAKSQAEMSQIEQKFRTSDSQSLAAQAIWEQNFPGQGQWAPLESLKLKAKTGGMIARASDSAVKLSPQLKTETYTLDLALDVRRIAGLRIEALPPQDPQAADPLHAGFSLSHISAMLVAPATNRLAARSVRLELPGKDRILSLAEVQVFHGRTNVALSGEASQSSTAFDGPARLAIDGNTNGDFAGKSVTHTEQSENPWWELDLKTSQTIDRISIWNRTDGGLQSRLKDLRITFLDENRKIIWERSLQEAPETKVTYGLNGSDPLVFAGAFADAAQSDSDLKSVVEQPPPKGKKGWPVNTEDGKPHHLTLLLGRPLEVAQGSRLQLVIEQSALHDHCPPAWFRISACPNERIADYAAAPEAILETLAESPAERSEPQRAALSEYYRANVAPELKPVRDRLAMLKKEMADIKPNTVPVMRELAGDKRRKTHIQFRGNYLALGDEVSESVPAAFHPLQKDAIPNRLAVARWLVDEKNPLTARVIANRFWEQIFGTGIVRTSEDFGSQGDLPTHPELLDWLACQLRDGDQATTNPQSRITHHASRIRDHALVTPESDEGGSRITPWNIKAFLKLLVTSATYQQSSRVTTELKERDPENLLLARGPRFRMTAEIVRDQALAVSGLLSPKMFGPPVRPPRPALGLSAAFGGSLDWKPSEGEDRYRRAIYIEWRRTSLYPSMAAFDAPNREVCALRRTRSNTPLQALVTLNDPVYVEAAQALARRMAESAGSIADKARYGFRLCLARPPRQHELRVLTKLYEDALAHYNGEPEQAKQFAMTGPQDHGTTGPRDHETTGEQAGGTSTSHQSPITNDTPLTLHAPRSTTAGPFSHHALAAPESDEGGSRSSPTAALAAWTTVGNVLLNLDETLMRP